MQFDDHETIRFNLLSTLTHTVTTTKNIQRIICRQNKNYERNKMKKNQPTNSFFVCFFSSSFISLAFHSNENTKPKSYNRYYVDWRYK